MKKLCLIFIFFVFCGISIFGENDAQEEVDFLLFLPNSSNQFVNEEQTVIQLNRLAQYLSNKNLVQGQIIVYGYAAFASNDIDSVDLSKERASFVINELQKRGISKDLFSEPVGHGSVYLWGNNADEDDRKPNRRVRILLSGESPISVTQEIINAEIAEAPDNVQEAPITQVTPEKSTFKFPWWILLLLPILLLLLALKKRPKKSIQKDTTTTVQPQIPKTDTVPVSKPEKASVPSPATVTTTVNLDEEIRFCAYEHFLRRNGVGDYRDQDWYDALGEVSARYTPRGYSVFFNEGYWWASITTGC